MSRGPLSRPTDKEFQIFSVRKTSTFLLLSCIDCMELACLSLGLFGKF